MGSLEPKIVGRRNVQDEPEVYVNQEAFLFINKNVSIMTILDLEDIGNHWIGCLRPDKIFPCLLEPETMFRTKIAQKELIQRLFISFSYWVSRDTVWHNFNDASDIERSSCSIW